MRNTDDVVAILCSDIHFSHRPPIARSLEEDWYGCMAKQWRQVEDMAFQHKCPIVIAGDLFDDGWRPNKCPPELINFVLKIMRAEVYAIPGQHDLPYHNLDDIEKSAYWTLVRAGKIRNLEFGDYSTSVGPLCLHGFPWGVPVVPNEIPPVEFVLHVAIVHAYVWMEGHSFKDAPEEGFYKKWMKKFKGYDAVVIGDNHSGWWSPDTTPPIINPGTFMRRRTDERDYQPRVGKLLRDGSIKRKKLDCSLDTFIDLEEDLKASGVEKDIVRDLLLELQQVQETVYDFADFVKEFIKKTKINKRVEGILLRCLGE